MALVIGNAAYATFKPLKNPANDAVDVATALKLLGFKVIKGQNLKRGEMLELLRQFQAEAKDADAAVFYYAGHGFQVDQKNYLVPVDAVITKAADVRSQTIDLQDLTKGLESDRSNRLIFLDACRDNPLRGKPGEAGASETAQDGLARLGSAAGFLFAYATQPDNTAFDGGGRNSPFAQAFLSHLSMRGQDLSTMMIEVRKDVIAATGGYQVPWENSSLTTQFFFLPGQPAQISPETQLWQLAASSRDASLLRVYLSRYPEGAHVNEAQRIVKIASLEPDGVSALRSTSDVASISDDRLWDLAQRSRIRALVEFYVDRRPDGRHAVAARELLQTLPSAEEADLKPEVVCDRSATHPRDATADTPGVPLADLARNGDAAVAACRAAREAHPEMPHYAALLARALAATGQRSDAIELYRTAAAQGDLRAMVSLGLILETGDGSPRDPKAAYDLYTRAAERGSPDGAINLAVALMEGTGIPRDPARAINLLQRASAAGSAIATYNLGVLTERGVTKSGSALRYFVRATELGDPRGFLSAAILLDEGRSVAKNPADAAEMLLRGAAADTGEVIEQMVRRSRTWSPDTVRVLQSKLRQAGYYSGPIDGQGGPKLRQPLEKWRLTGTLFLQ
ncbi:putative caspase-like protein/TPR repeat protein [Methylobacterium brachiatum]|uniref:Caspase-like protein/TPR repeat protein n=1 Tax=Methylobacterium brachiatum TaxID=269660 RepID=A0AAJ1TXI9_9HYPH|nr:caspase family protein [Methylobacterium brachiatum]MDQ0546544.1 putative caspase-like protein/TPR repeat protein [Methylobacterium brachiatum]